MPELGHRYLFLGTLAYAGLTLFVGLGGTAFAQDQEQIVQCKKVPVAVRSAFEKAYPKARIKGCAKELEKSKTAYEISSVEGKKGRDVLYYPDGRVIVVEETIAIGILPTPVKQAVHKKFPNGEIILAEKLMRGSAVTYEFQIKHKGKIVEIAFDPKGNEVEL
jgi:putative PepSY-like beta-lactamase-inhibitor